MRKRRVQKEYLKQINNSRKKKINKEMTEIRLGENVTSEARRGTQAQEKA